MIKIKSETMIVTPDMARVWLSKNKKNRGVSAARVGIYADEMRRGNWELTHQGIAIYEDGTFADGQHRLLAIIESGIAVPMVVTTGLSKSSALCIDSHQSRQAHHSIKISGLADWIGKEEVAVIRMVDYIENSGRARKLPHSEIISIGEKYKSTVVNGCKYTKKIKKHITTAMIYGTLGIASLYEDSIRLDRFYEVLYSGMPENQTERSAILLREFLISEKHGGTGWRIGVVRRTMRAIKAFCDYEPLKKLYQPDKTIYMPVPDDQVINPAKVA